MDKNYLIVKKSIEDPEEDILENDKGFAIQVSLPVVGEHDDKQEAEKAAGSGEFVIEV